MLKPLLSLNCERRAGYDKYLETGNWVEIIKLTLVFLINIYFWIWKQQIYNLIYMSTISTLLNYNAMLIVNIMFIAS